MAQGKAYTPEQKEQAIQSLEEYLKMGFSRNKACNLIGLPPATLSNWVSEDETLGMRLEGWENYMTALAVANIQQAIIKEVREMLDSDASLHDLAAKELKTLQETLVKIQKKFGLHQVIKSLLSLETCITCKTKHTNIEEHEKPGDRSVPPTE
jgi:transposase-like protein